MLVLVDTDILLLSFTCKSTMEKCEIVKLMSEKSDRVSYAASKGVSDVWPSYLLVNVDEKFQSYVKCIRCSTLLKWKSRDGTSGLQWHIKSCAFSKESKSQKLNAMPFFTTASGVSAKKSLSAADKSDLADDMATMCATDIR